jgi:uncharacterized protein
MLGAVTMAAAFAAAPHLIAAGQSTSATPARLRTETVDGTIRYTNRLIDEKSPYLQLHAHNPVDWYPWGADAFEKARRENKPIFLSIGYSTCHWCHVMEAESFSDPTMAALMNASFVSIKVDREERPDVDRVYMAYLLGSSGGGAWPVTVFLTPDLKPFLAGSYFPPDDHDGQPGLRNLLQQIARDWTTRKDTLLRSADAGVRVIASQSAPAGGASRSPNVKTLDAIYKTFQASYDKTAGGFGTGQKFPRPAVLNFLLRYYARTKTKSALDMVLGTLDAMAAGGIHDHLGGGFHRYATDRAWRVPHFEKMLYDQAQVATSYTEAYQITKAPRFADVARDTLDYVLRDMRSTDGAFFSAEDADSRPEPGRPAAEGAFYVWTDAQVRTVIGDDADLFEFYYGITPAGNVSASQDPRGDLKGQNVLAARHSIAETAASFKRTQSEVRAVLDSARTRLLAARSARPRPARDDKVLAEWNGMMISALARAAEVFDSPAYLDSARAAAAFVEARMYDPRTNLLKRRYRQGQVDVDGTLEDYVFMIQGALDLYEASFDPRWLAWAIRLEEQQDLLFLDSKGGGYFSTRADAANIVVRMKDDYDGAEPSANSVAAMNLLRLADMTDRKAWHDQADMTFGAMTARLTGDGASVPQLAAALDFSVSSARQIVIAGDPAAADTRVLLRLVNDRFIPNKIIVLADGAAGQAAIAQWMPFVADMSRRNDRATMYVCENYICRLPTDDPQVAARLLDGTRPKGAAPARK